MNTANRFLPLSIKEFKRLKQLCDSAIEQVSVDQFFKIYSKNSNSLATLVKHMSGNMISRWTDFLTTDGEKDSRNRDLEFVIQKDETQESLLNQWEAGWSTLFDTLSSMKTEDLEENVTIRGEAHSVTQAIFRQLSHYSYHCGQIVLLAKQWTGSDWNSLSIPLGKSDEFNQSPDNYNQDN